MSTPTYGFPFPTRLDIPDVCGDLQALAEAVDAAMTASAHVGGVWKGTLNFTGGWADVPAIGVRALPSGQVWSPTATVHETHTGQVWVCTVPATGAQNVYLRVNNVRDASFSGSQYIQVHWRATPADAVALLQQGEPA